MMRDTFMDALRKVIFCRRNLDNSGFCHYIPAEYLDDLEREFKAYCRKHGIKARPSRSSA